MTGRGGRGSDAYVHVANYFEATVDERMSVVTTGERERMSSFMD